MVSLWGGDQCLPGLGAWPTALRDCAWGLVTQVPLWGAVMQMTLLLLLGSSVGGGGGGCLEGDGGGEGMGVSA